jgi:DNA-binding MarR family transcriptional regulator
MALKEERIDMALAVTEKRPASIVVPAKMAKREAPFLGARLHQTTQAYEAAFDEKVGFLTMTQLQVMCAVVAADQPSQTYLVQLTGIDRSTLADVVRRLVKQGRLVRKRTKEDARMYAVKLTAEGVRELEKAIRLVEALDAEIGADILKPLRRG